jgi:hypothetical protein
LPLISTGLSLLNIYLFSDEYSMESTATNIKLSSLLIRLLGYDAHCELKLKTVGVSILNLFLFLIRRVVKGVFPWICLEMGKPYWNAVCQCWCIVHSRIATPRRDDCTSGVSEIPRSHRHFRTLIFRLPLSQNHLELFRWNMQAVIWTPL